VDESLASQLWFFFQELLLFYAFIIFRGEIVEIEAKEAMRVVDAHGDDHLSHKFPQVLLIRVGEN